MADSLTAIFSPEFNALLPEVAGEQNDQPDACRAVHFRDLSHALRLPAVLSEASCF